MPSTYTPNRIYELQATGENAGTWGTLLNAVLSIIDLNLGGRLALNVAGNADVTLTSTQERNAYILMTGVLTGSISLVFTATNGGFYLLDNRSTGSFTITAKPSGGTGVIIPQGGKCLVMVDPDNTRCVAVDLAQMMTAQGDILYRDASGVQRLAAGTSGQFLKTQGAAANPVWAAVSQASVSLLGYLYGLTLSNDAGDATNDLDIATGYAAEASGGVIMNLGSAYVKQLDAAWAVGTNQGMRDTGAISNATWHIFLIQRSDTAVVDVLASLSPTAPTMPASYDRKRRIGSIVRSGGAIKAFTQLGDEFLWKTTPVADVAATSTGTAAVTRTLTVPTGIQVDAIVQVGLDDDDGSNVEVAYISPLDTTDVAPSATAPRIADVSTGKASDEADGSVVKYVRTNTSAQVRSRVSASSADITLYLTTLGWVDDRGQSY